MCQNAAATALRTQGTRTDGPEGAHLLTEAVAAYRAALEVRTRADHPVDWAITQENIAEALLNRARRPETPDLHAALAAVDGALDVFDPDHMSYNHGTATRQSNDFLAALNALPD